MQHTRKRAGLLKSALLGAATIGALSLAAAGVAQAGPTIHVGLQQANVLGGVITQVATGSPSGAGVIGYSYGSVWTINQITAAGDLLPGDEFGTTSINTTATSSNSATELNVWATETDITDPVGTTPLLSGFTLNNHSGTFNRVVETTYLDPGNHVWGTGTQLSTATFLGNAQGNPAMSSPVGLTGPYAITEEFQVYMNAGSTGTSNATITLQAVPEPGSLALLGTGLLGLGLVARRRRRKA